MDEQKSDIEEQMNLIDLMKGLTEAQVKLAKIDAQIALREGKDQVMEIIKTTRQNLEEQAKKFGANLKKVEEEYRSGSKEKKDILEEYEAALTEINENYQILMQDVLEKKSQLEADEQETMISESQINIDIKNAQKIFKKQDKAIRAEIVRAVKEGRLEDAQQKMDELKYLTENNPINILKAQKESFKATREELRTMIENLENEFEKILCERKAEIDKVSEEKNNKLALIPKQNIFQKAIGAMFSKFNGTKKFVRTVIEPLKEKIATIKEEDIPKIKQKISEKRQDFVDNVVETRVGIKEKVQSRIENYALKLAETQQKAVQSVIDMRDSIVEKNTDFKDGIAEKANEVRNGVVEKTTEFADNVKTAKNNFVNATKEKMDKAKNVVVTNVTSTIDMGKNTFKNTINRGRQLKLNLIIKAQEKLQEKQRQLTEKMQILNPDLTQENQGTEICE
jgi:hypothetical protein